MTRVGAVQLLFLYRIRFNPGNRADLEMQGIMPGAENGPAAHRKALARLLGLG
jgi:hypothetical protein